MAEKSPKVDAYIAKARPFARPILEHFRALVHATCPKAEEAIKWAAENIDGAFPLRGDKSPMAYIKTDKKSYSGETIVIAKLPSDLAVYPSASNWTSVIAGFAAELVKLNGVRGQDVYINQVELKIDTEVTTVKVAKKHIQQLLDSHASNNSSDYMPFESGSPVKVNWFTKEIMK